MTIVNLFNYSSAVCGYHYYRRYWHPQPEQRWVCSHEKNNPYDFFAIKVTVPESGTTVGHQPMENSRVTKYILDRGAHEYAVLTSTNYCVSPLVQGGLEIPCHVEIHMPSTVKYRELIRIYEKYVDTLYYRRDEKNIAGSFVESSAGIETMETNNSKGRESKKRKNNETTKLLHQRTTELSLKNVEQFQVRKKLTFAKMLWN